MSNKCDGIEKIEQIVRAGFEKFWEERLAHVPIPDEFDRDMQVAAKKAFYAVFREGFRIGGASVLKMAEEEVMSRVGPWSVMQ